MLTYNRRVPSSPPTAPAPLTRSASGQRAATARYLTLLRTLTLAEFKLRYAHSSLGYFWAVSKPLMLFGVMYVVFSEMLRFGEGIPFYPVVLLLGIMLWGLFSESTSGAVVVLVARADMLRKASFPRSVLPVSVVMTSMLVFVFNLVALFVFVALAGVPPRWEWLWLLPLLAELGLLTIGASLLLSGLYVYMRDIGQLWTVVLQLMFYATPIIYPLELLRQNGVSELVQALLLCSPMAQIVQDARWALVGGVARPAADIQGALAPVPFAVVALLLGAGLFAYRRYSGRLAEHV